MYSSFTINCSLRRSCWLDSHGEVETYFAMSLILNWQFRKHIFHMSNKVKNISGNLQVQSWRSVVSSNLWAQVWGQGLGYLFASRQPYSEVILNTKGALSFNFSLKETLFASCPDLLRLSQGDTAGPTRSFLVCCWDARNPWEEHTRSIYKVKPFQAPRSSIPIPICLHFRNIWRNIFLTC